MSHVVHYGSSVFEGIRCYRTPNGPAVFRLADHLRRLSGSARIYRMEMPYSRELLEEASLELIRRNRLDECYLRPVALRGLGAAGVNPMGSPVETYIVCWPWGAYLGAAALEQGVDACVSSWSRPAPNTFPAQAKAGGALGETGSVSFMFDRVGEIVYPASAGDADKVMEAAIEAGAEDVHSDENGHVVICAFEDIGEVTSALETSLGEAESVKTIWRPQTTTPVDEERAQSILKLIAVLEDDDDVQNVYANFEVDDATMAKLSAA
jgi:hypothetical protein